VAVFPVAPDGGVGAATSVVQHQGRGPHPERQTSPHAHCIVLDAANRFALAADLGIDRVLVRRFDAASGALTPAAVPEVALQPGAGPRHLAFSPDGRTLYAVNELDSTLVVFAYDPETGGLRERQTLSTRPADATTENFPADLHVHPSGRTVYASNRGDDTIAVFAVAPDSGRLTLEQSVPTGGRWPRNFAIDPAGELLLVANQRSDSVVGFRIDPATGQLTPNGSRIELPAPVCLLFADEVSPSGR
jgi:6-phosphogluconolactonase